MSTSTLTPSKSSAIAASLRDQMLDVHLGITPASEYACRVEKARDLGVEIPNAVETFAARCTTA